LKNFNKFSILLSYRFSLLIAILIHIAFYFSNTELNTKSNDISIQFGTTISYLSNHKISNNRQSNNIGDSKPNESIESNSDSQGAITEEIKKIQNNIQYPPDALEQELESDCTWEIIVGKNQKMSSMNLIKPCKYKIFEKEFEKVIGNWNFNSPENSILIVPLRFRIEK
jgi:cytoskeletal protein RodZ